MGDYIKKYLGAPSGVDVEELRAENEELKRRNSELQSEVESLRKELETLRAEQEVNGPEFERHGIDQYRRPSGLRLSDFLDGPLSLRPSSAKRHNTLCDAAHTRRVFVRLGRGGAA